MTEGVGDRLDAARIRRAMSEAARAQLRHLSLLQETDSTNGWITRLPPDQQHAHAVLAEQQNSGRGRRQRSWHSPAGGNVYLSLGWIFHQADLRYSTLPLVIAIAVSQALSRAGLEAQGIKWPNDILADGRKLAGILVEMQSTGQGPALAVIGVGLNVRMPDPEQVAKLIDRPWTDLVTQLPEDVPVPNRNGLAALMLDEILPALEQFEDGGFEPFREAWEARDLLHGRALELDIEGQKRSGTAIGVDAYGGLLLQAQDGVVEAYHSGEVSVIYG
jgi:BirA family biotin operon repressor/biotin-[acetyl-CoA-carboxylase] ligase